MLADDTELLEDPSSYELNKLWRQISAGSIVPSVRFIADAKHKHLYIFNGSTLHYQAAQNIPSLNGSNVGKPRQAPHIFTGGGEIANNKITIDHALSSGRISTPATIDKSLKLDWSFADKYLDVPIRSELLHSVKENAEHVLKKIRAGYYEYYGWEIEDMRYMNGQKGWIASKGRDYMDATTREDLLIAIDDIERRR